MYGCFIIILYIFFLLSHRIGVVFCLGPAQGPRGDTGVRSRSSGNIPRKIIRDDDDDDDDEDDDENNEEGPRDGVTGNRRKPVPKRFCTRSSRR